MIIALENSIASPSHNLQTICRTALKPMQPMRLRWVPRLLGTHTMMFG